MPAPASWSRPWGFGGGGGVAQPLPVSPDVGASGQDVGRELSLPLPEVFPVPEAQLFNAELQRASIIAETFTLGFTPAVTILAGYFAVVNSFTIYVQNMLATSNLLWTLLANGVPVNGYTGLTIFPGASPRAANTFDAPIRLTGAQTLSVSITNGDGGTYLLGAAISGWQWPISSDRRWKTSGPVDAG
jgi:hypothetical protein